MENEFYNILQNIDIVIYIYKLLSIEDQFRLARVNDELKEIFERYISPQEDYTTLKIIRNYDYFVVTNESGRKRLALESEELQEFLQYHKNHVRIFAELNSLIFDTRAFPYLTELHYCFMQIPGDYFQLLGALESICPKLEVLDIDMCFDEYRQSFTVGKNLNTKSLLQMEKLKKLHIINTDFGERNCLINFGDFQELLGEMKLESLILAGCCVHLDNGNFETTTTIKPPLHLKELNIGLSLSPTANITKFFNLFENLNMLNVSVRDEKINDLLLKTIVQACGNLCRLCIRKSTFNNINSFVLPPKLNELSLIECRGLNKENLHQILTNTKLQKFVSETSYYGREPFKDINISPSLQQLHFRDRTYMQSYKLAFGGSLNLKYLCWEIDSEPDDSWYDNDGLKMCTNLEELDLREGFLCLSTLSEFKLLRKLSLRLPAKLSSIWNYITTILQHPSLTELCYQINNDTVNLYNSNNLPALGFSTNIRTLKIPLELAAVALDFWLDLFHQNKQLQLEIYDFGRIKTEFLRTLVNHKKFPKYLKTMDVCFFTISKD